MAEGRLLRQLLKAGSHGDVASFREVAEEVIRGERQKRHHLLANELERILYGEADHGAVVRPMMDRPVPRDNDRGLDLVVVRQPVRSLEDLVLSDDNRSIVDEVLLEQSRRELLGSFGLRPATKLLLCGPPGCGKTTTGEVLATELALPLAIVRFDAVVSSLLGETAANLRKVFDYLADARVVALFDEFDAVGKEREDSTEHGELKRVVNAFLQMMDGYRGQSLLLAATNHERLLDQALWRRFDDVLLLDKPSSKQLETLFSIKLRGVRYELPLSEPDFLSAYSELSHADVERVIVRAIKLMVLKGREFLTITELDEAKRREEYRLSVTSKL